MKHKLVCIFCCGLVFLLGGPGLFLFAQPLSDSLQTELNQAVAARWGDMGYMKSGEQLEALWEVVEKEYGARGEAAAQVKEAMGGTYYLQGEYDLAEAAYQHAIDNYEGMDQPEKAYNSMYGLGIAYRGMGDYYRSEDYAREALELAGEKSGMEQGKCWNALGNVLLRQQDFAGAKEAFATANGHLVPVLGEDHQFIGALLGNLGVAQFQSGDFAGALKSHQRANAIFQLTLPPNHPSRANPWVNLGETFLELATGSEDPNLDSAALYLEKASAHWKAIMPDDNPLQSEALAKLAEVAGKKGDLFQSMDLFKQAIRQLGAVETMPDEYPEDLESISSLPQLYEIEWAKARFMAQPMLHFRRLNGIVEALRKDFRRESTQLFWSRRALEHYEAAIAWCHSQDLPDEAFDFAERARSVLLYANLQGADRVRFAGVPPELLQQERSLKTRTLQEEQRLAGAEGKDALAARSHLRTLKEETEDLIRTLERDYPAYYELKYAQEPIPLDSVRAKLPNAETAWVQYFLGEEFLYGWWITVDTVEFRVLAPTAEVTPLLQDQIVLQTSLAYQSAVSQGIWEILLGSFTVPREEINQVIIVRDGLLHQLSFAGLETSGTHPRGRRYVIDDCAVGYAPSASVYFRPAREEVAPQPYAGLGRSFPDGYSATDVEGNRLALGALAQVPTELAAGVNAFGGQSWQDALATESVFRAAGSQARVLHFATHTLYADARPLNSRLVLSPDSAHDGLVHTYELFELELAADLVVLGACNTGKGEFQAGEGVMSLAQGFAYTGCPSILMHHWPVSDAASAEITAAFFGFLGQGMSKPEALRQAQLAYLETAPPVMQHPQFWASSGLIGDIAPLEKGGNGLVWVVLLALGGLVARAFFWLRSS